MVVAEIDGSGCDGDERDRNSGRGGIYDAEWYVGI